MTVAGYVRPGEVTTGWSAVDAMLPAALRLVCAAREGDLEEVDAAMVDARAAGDGDRDWFRLFALALAAMVPDPDTNHLSVLLAWCAAPRPPRPPVPARGERHPRATLSTVDVARIRASYRPNRPGELTRLAGEFNTCRQNIHKIVNFQTRVAG